MYLYNQLNYTWTSNISGLYMYQLCVCQMNSMHKNVRAGYKDDQVFSLSDIGTDFYSM